MLVRTSTSDFVKIQVGDLLEADFIGGTFLCLAVRPAQRRSLYHDIEVIASDGKARYVPAFYGKFVRFMSRMSDR